MKAYQAKHDQDKYQSKYQNNFQEDVLMKEKVVLAYSGGLDTTAIIPWLKEHFNYDVVCCCIDCGLRLGVKTRILGHSTN